MRRPVICSLTLALVLGACWAEPPEADEPAEPARSQPEPDPAPPEVDPAPTEVSPPPPEVYYPPPEVDLEPLVAPGPTFTVIARLLEVPPPLPHCGILHVTGVFKLEVLRVVKGRFKETILYTRVSCPNSPPTRTREFSWTVGETYELTLLAAGVGRLGALPGEPDKLYELFLVDESTR
jgi:hypothetical protein